MVVEGQEVAHVIELRGVYDGWSVAVLADGTYHNRWRGEGSRREKVTDAFINGEEPSGRWW